MGSRYLGTEALIGQQVAWYRGSNWAAGALVQRISLGSRYIVTEALIGQEVPWFRGSDWSGLRRYLSAEAGDHGL